MLKQQAYPLLVDELLVRIVDEGIFRLRLCVNELSLHSINHQWNNKTLSVAQSIVHLNGNVRQWLFEHLLGKENTRQRALEFKHQAASKEYLCELLSALEQDLKAALPLLKEIDPNEGWVIQGISNTTVSVLVHVIEHFSYHTGQVALLTKLQTNSDLGFYKDHEHLG